MKSDYVGVEVDRFQDTLERLGFREVPIWVEDLDSFMLYVVVLWVSGDYTPYMGLKWEPQKACITAGTRSQDGGRSHSKREKGVHVGQDKSRAACQKKKNYMLQKQNISKEWKST